MQTGDIKFNYKELVLYANDDRNYNRWKQPSVYDKWGNVTSKLWMVILGYATCIECTLLTNVFWDISLFWQTGKTFKDMEAHFCKGSASYTAFGVYTVCWYFPHRYQALFSLHITDVPSSQNTSLYLCSGVLFWVVFPGDHCIFSFVFCLFWPLVFILRATKLSEYPTAPSEKLHLTTFSIY